jgi:exonuclease VII small subunit
MKKKEITDLVYDYVKQIDAVWGEWDKAREIYKKGMEELEQAYKNHEVDYVTYEHLQDVLAHQN